jgi:tripartite-type tricarboxylate transporter receptor subunit TctC
MLQAVFCAVLVSNAVSAADAWPSNPIKLVVTFPPGGSTDVTARQIAKKIRTDLGRAVIVNNKAGAGGNIGAEFVAKAPADGYTQLMATSSHVTN